MVPLTSSGTQVEDYFGKFLPALRKVIVLFRKFKVGQEFRTGCKL